MHLILFYELQSEIHYVSLTFLEDGCPLRLCPYIPYSLLAPILVSEMSVGGFEPDLLHEKHQ